MASYGLYLGKLQGEVLLHKRHRTTMPADFVGFDTAVLSESGMSHDPYRTRTWSGESLQELRQEAHDALSRREQGIRKITKVRMGKSEIDSGLLPVIQKEIEGDRRHKVLCERVEFVGGAVMEKGTIFFWPVCPAAGCARQAARAASNSCSVPAPMVR